MRALITGSAGFIGRHFRARLAAAGGWQIRCVDIADGQDARDFFRLSAVTWPHYDLVVHAAAVVGGREVIDGSPLAQSVNLGLDAGLFEWARGARPGRILYFSSSAAYPVRFQSGKVSYRLGEDDIDPDDPGLPDKLYGWTKLTGELLARLYRDDGGKVTVVRPFSGYGPDQDATYPFGAFCDRALRREDPFTVWGDGQQVRDFIHVDDIVSACLELAAAGHDGPVNLGSGTATSMAALAARICEAAGYVPRAEFTTAKPGGVRYRVSRNERMLAVYQPRVSLDDGIERALQYRARLLAHP